MAISTSTIVASFKMGTLVSASIINLGNNKFATRLCKGQSVRFVTPVSFAEAKTAYTDFCKSLGRIYQNDSL